MNLSTHRDVMASGETRLFVFEAERLVRLQETSFFPAFGLDFPKFDVLRYRHRRQYLKMHRYNLANSLSQASPLSPH